MIGDNISLFFEKKLRTFAGLFIFRNILKIFPPKFVIVISVTQDLSIFIISHNFPLSYIFPFPFLFYIFSSTFPFFLPFLHFSISPFLPLQIISPGKISELIVIYFLCDFFGRFSWSYVIFPLVLYFPNAKKIHV